jgi:hypothetical protein
MQSIISWSSSSGLLLPFAAEEKRRRRTRKKKKKKKKKKGVMDVVRLRQLVRHPGECRKMRKLEERPCLLVLT